MNAIGTVLVSFLPTTIYAWIISEALDTDFWWGVLVLYIFLFVNWVIRSVISWGAFYAFVKDSLSNDFLTGLGFCVETAQVPLWSPKSVQAAA